MRSLLQTSSRLLIAALGACMLLWRALGDRWGWLGMVNSWAGWSRYLLAVLGLQALLRREWWEGAAALAFWALGSRPGSAPLFRGVMPRQAGETYGPETTTLSLFSANLYKFNESAAAHIELIRRESPDVLCFQEFRYKLADELCAALGDLYPYRVLRPTDGAYGLGFFSRFPLEETGYWEEPGVRPWGHRVRCTLPGDGQIEVYNVHLVPPFAASTREMGLTWGFRTREAQVRLMQDEIAARRLPACVIGDHNFSDTADAYQMAVDRWQDAWSEAGRGMPWTWPMREFPLRAIPWNPRLLRLDYCFYTGPLEAMEMRVLSERTGSDHCPIFVRFRVG